MEIFFRVPVNSSVLLRKGTKVRNGKIFIKKISS